MRRTSLPKHAGHWRHETCAAFVKGLRLLWRDMVPIFLSEPPFLSGGARLSPRGYCLYDSQRDVTRDVLLQTDRLGSTDKCIHIFYRFVTITACILIHSNWMQIGCDRAEAIALRCRARKRCDVAARPPRRLISTFMIWRTAGCRS